MIYSISILICSIFVKQVLEAKVLAAYSLVILLLSWIGFNNVLLVSMGFYSFRSRLELLQDAMTTLLCISLVYFLDIYGVVLGFLISTFLTFAISACNLWPQFSIKVEWRVLFDLILTGIPIMTNGLLLTVMGTIDRILIATFLNRQILGIYSVASIGINILRIVLSSFGQMLFVKFAEMDGKKKKPGYILVALDKTTIILSCFLSPLISIIISSFPTAVILLLPQFASGIGAGKLLLAETFFSGISLPSANWCISTGRFIPILGMRIASITLEFISIYIIILYRFDLEFIALMVLSTSIIFSLSVSTIVNYLLNKSFIGGVILWVRWAFPFLNITFVMWVQEHYYTIGVGTSRAQLFESCLLGLIISLLAVIPLAFWAERRTGMIELLCESVKFFLKRRNSSQPEGKAAAG
jgi:O-antigen/teichoic acid export membrane protein